MATIGAQYSAACTDSDLLNDAIACNCSGGGCPSAANASVVEQMVAAISEQ
jgi:hypothetical protein